MPFIVTLDIMNPQIAFIFAQKLKKLALRL